MASHRRGKIRYRKMRALSELNFLCGMGKPEDLAVLPGGRWIVTSGMTTRSGLHLIDGKTKAWERWIAPAATARPPFDKCPSQSSPDEMQLHGISLRQKDGGHAILYAVNHGGPKEMHDMAVGNGHETIEIFDIDMTSRKPTLAWAGCVPLPGKLVANSVVSSPDGSIFATVMLHPDRSAADFWKGIPTGAVYKWTPSTQAFERVPGTELTGNNGIEISPDGKILYVTNIAGITSFSNSSPARRLASVKIEGSFADNIHWVNGRLIIAGPRTDLCPPSGSGEPCMAGYIVSRVDPESLALTELIKGPANPAFSGASSAIPSGNILWIGSYSADKIAYRILP